MTTIKERLAFFLGVVFGGLWFLFCSALGSLWLIFSPGNRQTLYVFGRVFCRGLVRAMGWRLDVAERDRLEALRPCVIVGNHQSFLDVVTFGSIFPRRTVSAGKREIGRIPIFGWFYRLSGNLIIDRAHARQALESLEHAGKILRKEKIAVWFMPEGHRNRESRLLSFKSGAFRLAIAAKAPIVPIVAEPLTVICDTRRWRARPGRLRMWVLEPILTEGLAAKDLPELMATVRSRMQATLDEKARPAPIGATPSEGI